jgi:hypothetical protein
MRSCSRYRWIGSHVRRIYRIKLAETRCSAAVISLFSPQLFRCSVAVFGSALSAKNENKSTDWRIFGAISDTEQQIPATLGSIFPDADFKLKHDPRPAPFARLPATGLAFAMVVAEDDGIEGPTMTGGLR